MPQQLHRIVNAVEDGSLQLAMRPEGFDQVFNRVDSIANRIVSGVIAAAFINGLAVLLSIYHPTGLQRWAGAAFIVGVGCVLLLGIYLGWSILRSRRN